MQAKKSLSKRLSIQKKLKHSHNSPACKSLTKQLSITIRTALAIHKDATLAQLAEMADHMAEVYTGQTVLTMNTTYRLPKQSQLTKMQFERNLSNPVSNGQGIMSSCGLT